jgi:putative transposase
VCWFVLTHLVAFLVDVVTVRGRPDHDKDLQILLLQRQRPQPRLTRWEKLSFAVLTSRLARRTAGPRSTLEHSILLFKPDTVLKWHRELVRRKWSIQGHNAGGRPAIAAEVEQLILRLAREDPRWGYGRIQGELLKLGHPLGRSTVRDVLQRHRVPPAPTRRCQSSTWHTFLRRHRDQLLACDSFTVETLCLKTVWVLFFIELGTRRVYLAGRTTTPDAAWVTQRARHLSWQLQDGEVTVRYLLHDRDGTLAPGFDAVFRSEGVEVVHTPYRAPTTNAITERWVGSVRRECLDHLLLVSEAHLRQVLSAYVRHYNEARPHQGLAQRTPVPCDGRARDGVVARRDLLGGLLREYDREAA